MAFFESALTFPTVIFSTLFLIVLLFWLVSLVGLADMDAADPDGDAEAEGGFIDSVGLGGVPVTISLSIAVMVAWMISIYSQPLLSGFSGALLYGVGSVLTVVCGFVGLLVTRFAIKPLRRFFSTNQASSHAHLLGLECKIATGKVTDSFGQAKVYFQGAEHLIEVRLADLAEQFKLGDSAVLIDYLPEKRQYLVSHKPWA